MGELGREPLQIVEYDIDYCSLVYGVAPCTAALGVTGDRKCFNTFATCQDRPNIDLGPFTLSFAKNQSGLPQDRIVYPCLESVRTSPQRITIGGNPNRRTSPLGTRSRVTITLKDFADSDNQVDRYADERRSGVADTTGAYEPLERSTFFAKLIARFPYFTNRPIRVRNGYVGDNPEDMPTRNYICTEWRGPDSDGTVVIVAQDEFVNANLEQMTCPRTSQGALSSAISSGFTGNVSLEPAGIQSTYPPGEFKASIGSEIVQFDQQSTAQAEIGRAEIIATVNTPLDYFVGALAVSPGGQAFVNIHDDSTPIRDDIDQLAGINLNTGALNVFGQDRYGTTSDSSSADYIRFVGDLMFHPNGTLYALAFASAWRLYSVNTATGAANRVGDRENFGLFNTPLFSGGAIAPNGTAYLMLNRDLYTINLATGQAAFSRNIVSNSISSIAINGQGDAFVADTSDNAIFQLNLGAGSLSRIGNVSDFGQSLNAGSIDFDSSETLHMVTALDSGNTPQNFTLSTINTEFSNDARRISARGLDGTTASAHDAGASIQQVYEVTNALPENVIRDLLVDFAGFDPGSINLTDWRTEREFAFNTLRFSSIVAQPTPVNVLLSEILANGFILWPDEISRQIRLRAIAPNVSSIDFTADDRNVLAQFPKSMRR